MLHTKVIDRLFERLAATYGSTWHRLWDGTPIVDVKTAWAHELSGFADNLKALAWALENLPDYPPNVIQFRALARRAPVLDVLLIESPKADPEKLRQELAKLETVVIATKTQAGSKDWARRILGRYERGDSVSMYSLLSARAAISGGQQ